MNTFDDNDNDNDDDNTRDRILIDTATIFFFNKSLAGSIGRRTVVAKTGAFRVSLRTRRHNAVARNARRHTIYYITHARRINNYSVRHNGDIAHRVRGHNVAPRGPRTIQYAGTDNPPSPPATLTRRAANEIVLTRVY